MKILMLGWELPPHNSGGLGVACYQLSRALAGQGAEIDFVLPYDAPHDIDFMKVTPAMPITAEKLANLGGAYESFCYHCETEACEHAAPKDLRGQQKRYTAFVEKYLLEQDPDVIHAHDWLTFEAGMRAKQITGKPLVAHVHATEFDRSGEHHGNPLVHDIEYNALRMADRVVAVSQVTKDIIVREYNIPADKVEVVHNSIDPEDFADVTFAGSYLYLEEMKKLGYKVVVSLGRLTVQKGLRYLIQAAAQVHSVNDKVLFLIAGDGELRNELIEQAAELGVAHNIIFTGFVRGQRWRDAYAIGDMFVMPSVSEPFGLTALEAAGTGNAVLLSKQSGAGEVLRSVLKFDFWDTDKLANYILAVAEQPVLRNTLMRNVQNEFARLSWGDVADKCHNIYKSVNKSGVPVA
ncbi:MAG TPA: glycosyltransferase family 4 protein [Candidatus Saccharimonadales bacterium]|nr:glycosyltransferase family 4 protein [Candidatus Saccharimonadales bacterium]